MKKLTYNEIRRLAFICLSAYNHNQSFTAVQWLDAIKLSKTNIELMSYLKSIRK